MVVYQLSVANSSVAFVAPRLDLRYADGRFPVPARWLSTRNVRVLITAILREIWYNVHIFGYRIIYFDVAGCIFLKWPG